MSYLFFPQSLFLEFQTLCIIILQYFMTKLLILNKYKTSNWKMQSPFSLIMRGIRSSGSENRKKKVKNHQEMSHVQMLAYFYKHMWDLFKYVIFHSASFCLIDYKHLWTSQPLSAPPTGSNQLPQRKMGATGGRCRSDCDLSR